MKKTKVLLHGSVIDYLTWKGMPTGNNLDSADMLVAGDDYKGSSGPSADFENEEEFFTNPILEETFSPQWAKELEGIPEAYVPGVTANG